MPRAKTPRNGNIKKVTSITRGKNNKTSVALSLEDEIRLRAYQLYEERGCTPGDEREDWLVAEREVRARHNGQQTA